MFNVANSPLSVEGVDQVPHPLLIEASAGTGKTWTLAHLATRFMLEENRSPGSLLLVTFTNEAAQSLRGRVRLHLEMVIAFLQELRSRTGDLPTTAQPWQKYFATFGEDEIAEFVNRGQRHLSNLDDIHAQTFHSFAMDYAADRSQALASGDAEFEQAFREVIARAALEDGSMFAELLDMGLGQTSRLEVLRRIAKRVFDAGYRHGKGDNRTIRLLPEGGGDDELRSLAAAQRDLVLRVLQRHAELLRKRNITTFSDLISNISRRLGEPEGDILRNEIRSRFDVVMIDEFQDTDPVQWNIFSTLFLDAPNTRLIAVGDPKQSIYSFRSASVETFIAVKELCASRGVEVVTLDTNRRSDPSMLAGLNSFFDGTDFHYEIDVPADPPKIPYVPVHASDDAVDAENFIELNGVGNAPIHLRLGADKGEAVLKEVGQYISLLHQRGQNYSSMVVLCYNNYRCNKVHRALTKLGIPSVTSADTSVFESDAALHVQVLLGALASPERTGLAAALAATWFVPLMSNESDESISSLVADFHRMGIAAVVRFLRSAEVLQRVIGLRDGDRHITDLLQIGELMAIECQAMRSLSLVEDWLIDARDDDETTESNSVRRLPTEGEAVRIMTTHAAKGLEFDTVLVPYLSANWGAPARSGDKFELLSWLGADEAVIDAGSGIEWGDVETRQLRSLAMIQGEYRRSAYVALTRAAHHLVIWAVTQKAKPLKGEFIRMIYDRTPLTSDAPSTVVTRSMCEVEECFVARDSKSLGSVESSIKGEREVAVASALFAGVPQIYVSQIGSGDVERACTRQSVTATVVESDVVHQGAEPAFASRVAPFVPWQKRRWSYTAIADELKATATPAPEVNDDVVGGIDEERRVSEPPRSVATGIRQVFGELAGNKLGVAVHSLLDRCVATPGATESETVYQVLTANGFSPVIAEAQAKAIASSIDEIAARPLGGVLEGFSLRSLTPSSVASELRFTMAVGDQPSNRRLADAADAVLREDHSGAHGGGVFASYFAHQSWLDAGASEGFLVGSMDLVVRRPDGKFVIVDYKTDQLAGSDRPYSPAAMSEAMERQHYVMQALVYSVALHRFLTRTLEGYEPTKHLGGCGYYFVRVVGDPKAAPEDGFFSWDLSPDAVALASKAMV